MGKKVRSEADQQDASGLRDGRKTEIKSVGVIGYIEMPIGEAIGEGIGIDLEVLKV